MKTSIELFVIEKTKRLRIDNNISQAELAFKMGVSTGFIGKVESKTSPTKYNLNHINKLSEIFDVNPQSFLPDKFIISV